MQIMLKMFVNIVLTVTGVTKKKHNDSPIANSLD